MHLFALTLLLQVAISPPEPPPWPEAKVHAEVPRREPSPGPRYTVAQGQAVVVKLDPATCVAGPVVILERTVLCRPDRTVIVGVPANALVGTHEVMDVHDHRVATLEIAGANFRGTRRVRKSQPLTKRQLRDKLHKDEAYSTHRTSGSEQHLRPPLGSPVPDEHRISDRFGPGHTAVDIAAPYEGGWASRAPDARAVAAGIVVLSEQLDREGNTVIVHHGDGIYTAYCHLRKRSVKVGHDVAVGDSVGRIGKTGAADGVHLHLTMRINDVPVDPMAAITLLNNSRLLQP